MRRLLIYLTTGAVLGWALFSVVWADTKPNREAAEIAPATSSTEPITNTPALLPVRPVLPQTVRLNWLSINSGGAVNLSTTNYRFGLSVGQPVVGFATSPSYHMGFGFWYGVPAAPACAAAKGDMNGSGNLSGADIVLLVNCTFNQNGTGTVGGDCNSCYADVNCMGGLSGADIVLLIAAAFNSAPFPC